MTRIALAPLVFLLAHCAPVPDAMPALQTSTSIDDGDAPRLVPLRDIYGAVPAHKAATARGGAHHWPAPTQDVVPTTTAAPRAQASVDGGASATQKLNADVAALRARARALQAPVHDSETRDKLRGAIKNDAAPTP